MRTLVIYDSTYGNTAKIAEAVGAGAAAVGKVKVVSVANAEPEDWRALDLLIVGSPTQGGRPTDALKQTIEAIPAESLDKTKVAVFDTRFEAKDQNFALRTLMHAVGYAADKIAQTFRAKGSRLVAVPEGFIVKAKEGPLRHGELERAEIWAGTVARDASV